MSKTFHIVRFELEVKEADSAHILIEQLRYAGLLKIYSRQGHENGSETYCLQINCPNEYGAKANAERMASFGIPAKADTERY